MFFLNVQKNNIKVKFLAIQRKFAFSLIELLFVTAIVGILAAVALPKFQYALLKTQIAKVNTDFCNIKSALELYYSDYALYPPQKNDFLFNTMYIQGEYRLTTPVSYLSPVPYSPWIGKYIKSRISQTNPSGITVHNNYLLATKSFVTDNNTPFLTTYPAWYIASSGPFYVSTGKSSKHWYSITNGLVSEGGFWMDSEGFSSF
jgi:prepilin-type N-terminal cleavage/methylation domain-containing protein